MEYMTVRESLAALETMQVLTARIIESMNVATRGGFENSMFELGDKLIKSRSLLEARAYGQLAPPFNPTQGTDHRPTDKPLSFC
jgi:hypothetical protein